MFQEYTTAVADGNEMWVIINFERKLKEPENLSGGSGFGLLHAE